jgi:hypothetical protein
MLNTSRSGAVRRRYHEGVSRDEARQLAVSLVFTVLVCVILLTFMGIRNVATQDSHNRGPAVACGRLVESRDIAQSWRKDCGIFPDSMPTPDPVHAPARPLTRPIRL